MQVDVLALQLWCNLSPQISPETALEVLSDRVTLPQAPHNPGNLLSLLPTGEPQPSSAHRSSSAYIKAPNTNSRASRQQKWPLKIWRALPLRAMALSGPHSSWVIMIRRGLRL